jgi:DNA invertase Pin-like site-specific DNA recombinase
VSTSRAEQLRSLSAQVSSLTRYVYDRYDWVLKDIYIDVGSAKTGSSRREFERMIEDCKSGDLDYIIVKSPSRFGRDSLEVIESVRAILDAGVKLYFEANDLKIESTYNELELTIINAMNQAENEQRSGNIKVGLMHRAETGDSGLYNRPCYGYKKNEEGNLVPDPDQAAVVSRIYRLYLDGKSISGIIEDLATEHIRSPRGSERWNKKAIETILTNEKYPGHVEILKTDPGRKSYYARNTHDPIVSMEDFVEVQKLLVKRARRKRKDKSSSRRLVEHMVLMGYISADGREKTGEN